MQYSFARKVIRVLWCAAILVHAASAVCASPAATITAAAPRMSNAIGMQFVLMPAGEFSMGLPDAERNGEVPAEYPPHRVRLSKAFYLGVHEVTQGQYASVMSANPSWHSAAGEGASAVAGKDASSFPVEQVSWHEATDFCRRLAELPDEKAARRTYRLPTEAQWEYACRAGKTTPYTREAASAGDAVLSPVGSGKPNELGLHDMRSSVWEWCADWHGAGYYAQSSHDDPQGPAMGLLRVVRGRDWVFGGYGDRPYLTRDPCPPARKSRWIGFRVVCETAK